MNTFNKIISTYKRLDKTIARFQAATGINCPDGCGICCMEWWVETSILEVLPLALEIYSRRQEEEVLISIQEKEKDQDFRCVLLLSEPPRDMKGSCGYYNFRPLLCRLFGFASRKNKFNKPEFSPCRIIKSADPDGVKRAEKAVSEGMKTPVYQEAFMRIASINPGMGFRILPINQALKGALEHLYWMNLKKSLLPALPSIDLII
jgi:Fe-S-cluster containining protein